MSTATGYALSDRQLGGHGYSSHNLVSTNNKNKENERMIDSLASRDARTDRSRHSRTNDLEREKSLDTSHRDRRPSKGDDLQRFGETSRKRRSSISSGYPSHLDYHPKNAHADERKKERRSSINSSHHQYTYHQLEREHFEGQKNSTEERRFRSSSTHSANDTHMRRFESEGMSIKGKGNQCSNPSSLDRHSKRHFNDDCRKTASEKSTERRLSHTTNTTQDFSNERKSRAEEFEKNLSGRKGSRRASLSCVYNTSERHCAKTSDGNSDVQTSQMYLESIETRETQSTHPRRRSTKDSLAPSQDIRRERRSSLTSNRDLKESPKINAARNRAQSRGRGSVLNKERKSAMGSIRSNSFSKKIAARNERRSISRSKSRQREREVGTEVLAETRPLNLEGREGLRLTRVRNSEGNRAKRTDMASQSQTNGEHDDTADESGSSSGLSSDHSDDVECDPYQGVALLHCRLQIHRGADLAAKDRNLLTRKKTSSDPYIEIWRNFPTQMAGKTATIYKTLEPTFHETFQLMWTKKELSRRIRTNQQARVTLKVWDEDKFSSPDAMGDVEIPIPLPGECLTITKQWFLIDPESARNAKGQLQVSLHVKYRMEGESGSKEC